LRPVTPFRHGPRVRTEVRLLSKINLSRAEARPLRQIAMAFHDLVPRPAQPHAPAHQLMSANLRIEGAHGTPCSGRISAARNIDRLGPRRAPLSPAISHRLIGDAGMITAIREPHDRLAAAEEKVGLAGIADRPMALVVGEFEN